MFFMWRPVTPPNLFVYICSFVSMPAMCVGEGMAACVLRMCVFVSEYIIVYVLMCVCQQGRLKKKEAFVAPCCHLHLSLFAVPLLNIQSLIHRKVSVVQDHPTVLHLFHIFEVIILTISVLLDLATPAVEGCSNRCVLVLQVPSFCLKWHVIDRLGQKTHLERPLCQRCNRGRASHLSVYGNCGLRGFIASSCLTKKSLVPDL